MNYCFIGARPGLGTSALALALTRSLDKALYISLDFGAKDLSRSLGLDPGIYDLFDVTNRGASLEDALSSSEGLDFIEAPLTKTLDDLDRQGLLALKDQAQESYDHLVWDLTSQGLDLVTTINPDQVLAMGSADLSGLYRLEDLVFRLRDYHKILTPIITGVEDREKLQDQLASLDLNLKDYKTLPFFKASQGQAFFYPKDTAKLITENLDHYQGAKPGLLQKIFRGNAWT